MKKNVNLINDGADWYQDRYEAVKVERNRYLLLLIVCFVALMISLLGNLLLFPLKTAVPYVIQTDKTTGITTVLKPTNTESLRQQEAVTTYFLFKYLLARMNYDYGLRKSNANVVRALSSAAAYRQYTQQIDATNPDSPIRQYKNNATIRTYIESYSFPYPDIAQVHFHTELQSDSGVTGNKPTRQYWLASIKFTYANTPLSLADREDVNPLGFFVTSFQLSQETPDGR